MRHFNDMNDLNPQEIDDLITDAIRRYDDNNKRDPNENYLLANKIVVNLFLEKSTRTRMSFSIAAMELGAQVIDLNINARKSERLLDTAKTICLMRPNALITRGCMIKSLSESYIGNITTINAGDDRVHPTQALLDLAVIKKYKEDVEGLNIAICGDIKHSRVAASNIDLLSTMGANLTIISPPELNGPTRAERNVRHTNELNEENLKKQDVLMILRPQIERIKFGPGPGRRNKDYDAREYITNDLTTRDYIKSYQINSKILSYLKKDAIIMHPGPVNIGLEVSEDALSDGRFVSEAQVIMGVSLRKALLKKLLCPTS